MPRKRTHDEMVSPVSIAAPKDGDMLKKVRNMWEFASLFEWISIFGQVAKIRQIDVEVCSLPSPFISRLVSDICTQGEVVDRILN